MQRTIEVGMPQLGSMAASINAAYNTFNMSHQHKTTFNLTDLIPCMCVEVVPGDKPRCNTEALLRMQPMISPVMQQITLRFESFYVPWRLLWENFEVFIKAQKDGSVAPAMPTFNGLGVTHDTPSLKHTIFDYLNFPLPTVIGQDQTLAANAGPILAYTKIWSDWYRDSVLEDDSEFQPVGDGDQSDVVLSMGLRQRHADKDYFTTAKPEAQMGDAVVIPTLVGDIPITNIGSGVPELTNLGGSSVPSNTVVSTQVTMPAGGQSPLTANGQVLGIDFHDSQGISAADFAAQAGTIEDLRRARALQKFLEADLVGGERYVETMQSQWGVDIGDARVDRAVYLGSGSQSISISEVLQTSSSDDVSPQGNMAGHGISLGRHGHTPGDYTFPEYGFHMVFASVTPNSGYTGGRHRMWDRFDRLDFAWPAFAEMGMEPITNGEVFYNYADQSHSVRPFGYVPRYNSYRTMPNYDTGDFRDNLAFWTLDNVYASPPALNPAFMYPDYAQMQRIFADESSLDTHMVVHFYHQYTLERKLPRVVNTIL